MIGGLDYAIRFILYKHNPLNNITCKKKNKTK